MATGGADDLFECSVCMEPMLNKQPRLLVCAHTFCSPCLQQLAAPNQVVCPKCRTATAVPSGNVESLPKNLDLSSMKELVSRFSDKLAENLKTDNLCKVCLKGGQEKRATHVCLDCSNKPICKRCADNHGKLQALKSHKIIELEQTNKVDLFDSTQELTCKEHKEQVQYFCRNCTEILCEYCALSENHLDHGFEILDFKLGFEQYRNKCNKTKSELEIIITKIDTFKKIAHSDLDMFSESKQQLKERCEQLKRILAHCEVFLKDMNEDEDKIQNFCRSFNDLCQDCANVYSKWSEILQKPEVECFEETKIMNDNITKVFDKANILMNTKYECKMFTVNSMLNKWSIGNFDGILVFNQDKYAYLHKPEMASEIRPNKKLQIRSPWDLIAGGEDSVYVVDRAVNVLQKVNLTGNARQCLFIPDDRYIQHACLYDQQMYVLLESGTIEHYTMQGLFFRKVTTYILLAVPVIRAIAAKSSSLVITEEKCVSEYNLYTRKREIRVNNLLEPCYTSITNNWETKYVITDQKAQKVLIYNGYWILQHTITSLEHPTDILHAPCRIAVTPGDKILVAQYGPQKISMFNKNGGFICVLLKLNQKPEAIAYTKPYLWVAHKEPEACLRVYKVGDL